MFNRLWYLAEWQKCQIRPECLKQHQAAADIMMSFKESCYDPASVKCGVPWYVIGALDCREEDFNHNGYLGNGDPLDKPTVHVPAGRGPFATWALGASDALMLNDWSKLG